MEAIQGKPLGQREEPLIPNVAHADFQRALEFYEAIQVKLLGRPDEPLSPNVAYADFQRALEFYLAVDDWDVLDVEMTLEPAVARKDKRPHRANALFGMVHSHGQVAYVGNVVVGFKSFNPWIRIADIVDEPKDYEAIVSLNRQALLDRPPSLPPREVPDVTKLPPSETIPPPKGTRNVERAIGQIFVGIAIGVTALLLAIVLARYNVVHSGYAAPLGLAGFTLVVSGLWFLNDLKKAFHQAR